ncbi:MAG: FtsX-like permease family protein, partial [Bacillota bacterium]
SMPSDNSGFLIDASLADEMLRSGTLPNMGITTYSDLLSLDALHDTGGKTLTITGIVESGAPVFYGDKSLRLTLDSNSFYALDLIEEDITLLEGDLPTETNEVLMPVNMVPSNAYDGSGNIDLSLIGDVMVEMYDYEVVGVYEIDYESNNTGGLQPVTGLEDVDGPNITRYVATSEAIENHAFRRGSVKAYFYVDDAEAFEAERDSSEDPLNNMYDQAYDDERQDRRSSSGGLIVFSVVTLVATAAAFYFIIRSSMMKRIYEIGVYRSLGVRRFDIIKLFLIEIMLITTFSSVLGYLGMTYALNEVIKASGELVDVFDVSVFTVFGGLLVIYAINALFGLLPLFGLLRKTPAQIQTVYDL